MDETLSEIIEYEKKLKAELNLSEQEAEQIIAQAKHKAGDLLEQEKANFSLLDKQCQELLKQELEPEKNKILQENEDRLKQLKNINETEINELVKLVVKKVTLI